MRRMLITATVAAIVLTITALGRAGGEKDSLQGRWILLSTVVAGKEFPGGNETRITFGADGKLIVDAAGKKEEQTYKVDDSQKPRALDMIRKIKDEEITITAIYEVTGDTLKVGSSIGGERPKSFEEAQRVQTFNRAAK